MWDWVGGAVLGILAAFAVVSFFGLTVFVHELGHYLAARMCGMVVETFSIGFGPALWKRRVGGTLYKIGWIPFGGYVALPQLDPSGMATIQGENGPDGKEGPPTPLASASWWKRILVSLAGPLGNVLLAFLIAFLISALPPVGIAPGLDLNGAVLGSVEPKSPAEAAGLRLADQVLVAGGTRVQTWDEFVTECHLASGAGATSVDLVVSNRLDGAVREVAAPLSQNESKTFYVVPGIEGVRLCGITKVVPDLPAVAAGLQEGDLLVGIDGSPLYGSEHFVAALQRSEGRPIQLRVMRKKELLDVAVVPVFGQELGRWVVGAGVGDVDPKVPMWMQYRNPWRQIKGDIAAVGRVLKALVAPTRKGESGRVAEALSGPIAILATMWLNTLANLLYTVGFVRFLNINLAILNLLPLPVLDGGHIVFALYEGITRRKVNARLLNWLINAFAILLLGLIVLVSVRDTWLLSKIFGRGHKDPAPAAAVEKGPAPQTPAEVP